VGRMGLLIRVTWKVRITIYSIHTIHSLVSCRIGGVRINKLIWVDVALFTSEQDVDNFLNANVNILAPSIGNVHGDYGPSGPAPGQLHFDRLQSIHSQIAGRVIIALHGTNDFPESVMKQCIEAGAVKLNVNKLLLEPGNEVIRQHGKDWGTAKLIDEVVREVKGETERWMDICGSSGKA
jgi:fructose-bisphosphate aldolase class II